MSLLEFVFRLADGDRTDTYVVWSSPYFFVFMQTFKSTYFPKGLKWCVKKLQCTHWLSTHVQNASFMKSSRNREILLNKFDSRHFCNVYWWGLQTIQLSLPMYLFYMKLMYKQCRSEFCCISSNVEPLQNHIVGAIVYFF